ncbi:MAG: LicD family protein, partial [Eubacterium sp.]|nr:LicD family protein [Eubacterium sp.]
TMRDKVIDGFLVPTMMQKAWGASFLSYQELRRVCKENGLRVFATWGTLLGAIRHKGFIPWDDDIDVCMLRKDFEELLRIVGREGPGYHIEDFVSTGTDNMVRRWIDKGVLIYPPEEWEKRAGFPYGDVIDICIMDSLPPDEEGRLEVMKTIAKYQERRNRFTDPARRTAEMKKLDEYLISLSDDPKNTYVTDLVYYKNIKDRILPKSYFDDVIEVPFEDGTMCVPGQYEDILKRYFGDYTKEVLEFDSHGYPFYEINKKELKEKLDFELLTYRFDSGDYERVMQAGRATDDSRVDEDRGVGPEKSSAGEDKRVVLLLPLSHDDWWSLEPIWRYYQDDKNTEVMVVPIPYKDKDAMGLLPEGNWDVDMDGYPDGVELIHPDEVDFSVIHPSVVVYQSPYDEYSDGYTVHPYLYSTGLREFCDRLILVPPFELREIADADMRSRYTAGAFICNPGAVYADEILVQTENMKQVFSELLDGFTGKDEISVKVVMVEEFIGRQI